jgi:hypothetical protein
MRQTKESGHIICSNRGRQIHSEPKHDSLSSIHAVGFCETCVCACRTNHFINRGIHRMWLHILSDGNFQLDHTQVFSLRNELDTSPLGRRLKDCCSVSIESCSLVPCSGSIVVLSPFPTLMILLRLRQRILSDLGVMAHRRHFC